MLDDAQWLRGRRGRGSCGVDAPGGHRWGQHCPTGELFQEELFLPHGRGVVSWPVGPRCSTHRPPDGVATAEPRNPLSGAHMTITLLFKFSK